MVKLISVKFRNHKRLFRNDKADYMKFRNHKRLLRND